MESSISYRLEIGKKCIYLDDVNRAIRLEYNKYTPMDFETTKKVINEIGHDVIKVFKMERKVYIDEKEEPMNIREFTK